MSLEAWLAGIWDGDGTKYIVKRKDKRQIDYFVKISTTRFLQVFARLFSLLPRVFLLPHSLLLHSIL